MRKFWLTMGAVCLLALLLAASALAQPSLEDARKAVVFVEFVFEDDSMQPAMGLVVGPPGKPSKYVLTDNWAMTDDTGENTASTAWVLSVDKFEPYEVVKAYVQPFTRLILLETETEIEGSEALRFADPTDFGVGSRVYPVALTWETEDADWTLCQGEIESIQSVGQTYDELMADVRLEDPPDDMATMSVTLDELGMVVGFTYDYSERDGMERIFPSDSILDALDAYGVPYGVAQSVSGAIRQEEEYQREEEETGEAEEAEGELVTWADPEFGRMVEAALGHTPTDAELKRVRALYLLGGKAQLDGPEPDSLSRTEGGDVKSLEDLKYFPNLTSLWVVCQPISDISPVAACQRLEFASLCYDQISDLSPLSGLSELTELYLYDNRVADVSPLSGLTRLDSLGLGSNAIEDITPLAGLRALTFLRLHGNYISDLSPLSGLKRLEDLTVSFNEVTDISALKDLTRLESLQIDGNMISDLSPLSGLARLEYLDAESNNITDLSPLSDLKFLAGLNVKDNPISDYSPVSFVENLERD